MANEIKASDMAKVLGIEFVSKFVETLQPLLTVLGIAEPEVIAAGTQIERYNITGTLQDGTVTEGNDVPNSKYEEELVGTYKAELKKYRKTTTEEAILKSGYDRAVAKTDDKFFGDIHNAIRAQFFGFFDDDNATVIDADTNLKAALSHAAGQLAYIASDKGYEGTTPVFFVNPLDVYDYLADANIYNVENAFGFRYIENFLGLGLTILDARVTQATVWATFVENINCYAVDLDGLNEAGFDYVADETGIVGVHHDVTYRNGVAETHVRTGLIFVPTYANMIVEGSVNPS